LKARELAQLLALQNTAAAAAGRRTSEGDEDSTPSSSSEDLDNMSDIGRNLPLTTRLRARNRVSTAHVGAPASPPAAPHASATSPAVNAAAAGGGICSACSYAKDKASAMWDQERVRLTAQINALEAQRAETKERQEAAVQALRARYQTMLDESQAALEMQTDAAREQIDRLSDLLRQAQHQLQMERIAHRNQQPPPPPPPQAAPDHGALNDELRETRIALEQASDQLVEAVHKVEEAEARHRTEVAALKDAVQQLQRDRDAREARVADLEQQLMQAELLAQQRQPPASGPAQDLSPLSAKRLRNVRGPQDPSTTSAAPMTVPAANYTDEALRGLLQKLNAVSSDRPAAPPAPPAGYSSSLVHGDASGQPRDPRAPPPAASTSELAAVDDAFEARLLAAEQEMKELQDALDAERRMNESLRSQLHDAIDVGDEGEGGEDDVNGNDGDGGAFDVADERAASRALLARSAAFEPSHGSPATAAPGTHTSPEGGVGAAGAPGGSSFAAFMRESAAEFVVPEGAGDKVRAMVRRMNDMRKRARAELARLRRVYSLALAREREREEEMVPLRTQAADARELVQSLREDVARKAKLLASLKEAKVGDNAQLEHAKAEAREHEESTKRLQRALASKDALVRDLKSRVEALEEQARAREAALKDHARAVTERSRDGWRDPEAAKDAEGRNKQREANFKLAGGGAGGSGGSSANRVGTPARSASAGRTLTPSSGDVDAAAIGGGSIHALFATTFAEADRRFDRTAVEEALVASTAHLSVSELRSRLRSSEVDRARCKLRLSALKDKVLDLELELKEAQRERDRALAVADRFEDLKAAVPRKDAIIKNYKAEVQRLRDDAARVAGEHDDVVIEAEKKIRHLQRQVDVADRYRAEAERELASLRERVMDLENRAAAVVRPHPARPVPAAAPAPAPAGGTYTRPRPAPAPASATGAHPTAVHTEGTSQTVPRRAPPGGASRAQHSEPAAPRSRASVLSPTRVPPLAELALDTPPVPAVPAAAADVDVAGAAADAMIGDEWAAGARASAAEVGAGVGGAPVDDEATTATDRPAAEPHASIEELPASLEGSIADLADIMNSLTMARNSIKSADASP